jgi:Flp pilus assembly protein TadD
MRLAIGFFEEAIARDPSYARAYAWLSDSHWLRVVLASAPAVDEVPRARAYAMKALAVDGMVAEGHWALGQVLFGHDFDWIHAGREFDRAIELDAASVEAKNLKAIYLLGQGRFEEAEQELKRALAVDPLVAEVWQTLGRIYLYTEQTDRAIAHLREALALSPAFSYARGNLGHAYFQKGMPSDAVAEFETAAATGGPSDSAQLAYAYAVSDRRAEATAIVDGLLAPQSGRHLPAYHLGMAYVGLADANAAFEWLERAYVERDPHIGSLNVMPAFTPLRANARFAALVRRMGLTP